LPSIRKTNDPKTPIVDRYYAGFRRINVEVIRQESDLSVRPNIGVIIDGEYHSRATCATQTPTGWKPSRAKVYKFEIKDGRLETELIGYFDK